ncbi:hypothetical protein L0U85_12645 [Glycomyces sp. L485]|uniref:bestrophin-like domain n=1 Tax=Glycomyces sp. L485 TaxID=2909235 RepID=UPI001F4AB549|nr:hypothetical protein [Glycomyces sp. L485]MCH7231692.1 hypothetical protein [Glycomyces sp. L485]
MVTAKANRTAIIRRLVTSESDGSSSAARSGSSTASPAGIGPGSTGVAERLFQAQRGLTGSMWIVLLPGALPVLIVSLTLGTPTRRFQFVLVALISGMVALLLFATYQPEYPFSRGGAVPPETYETALDRYDEIDAHYTD